MKGILFDLDGTLVNSMPVWWSLHERFIEYKGKDFDPGTKDKLREKSLEDLPVYLDEVYGIETSFDEIRDFMENTLIDHYSRHFVLKEGVRETLDRLKETDIKMCITTATDYKLCRHVIDRMELMDYMDFVQTPDKLGMRKSDPKFFSIARERLDTDPKDTYVFDDSLYALRLADDLKLIPVGVEDETSQSDRKDIKDISDIYLRTFRDLDIGSLL